VAESATLSRYQLDPEKIIFRLIGGREVNSGVSKKGIKDLDQEQVFRNPNGMKNRAGTPLVSDPVGMVALIQNWIL
jgi:hypothetical protein